MSFADAEIAVHRQPVWRARSNYVFHAPTPDVGGAEQLWAERIGDDRFVICCIPFFAYGVALGDIVALDPLRVIERSGRACFRVWFGEGTGDQDEVIAQLKQMEVEIERSSEHLIGLAPTREQTQRLQQYLAEGEERGAFMYEVGYVPTGER